MSEEIVGIIPGPMSGIEIARLAHEMVTRYEGATALMIDSSTFGWFISFHFHKTHRDGASIGCSRYIHNVSEWDQLDAELQEMLKVGEVYDEARRTPS